MRRLLLAGFVAIGAHGVLLLMGPAWVLPKVSPPKWSVQPVQIELNAICRSATPAPKVIAPKRANKKAHRTEPKTHQVKKSLKPRIKKKHIAKAKPKKMQVCKVRRRLAVRPLAKLKEKPKPIRQSSDVAESRKKAAPEVQKVKNDIPVPTKDKGADTSPGNGWADISEDILAEAPFTRLASLTQATAQEEALVEATPAYLNNPPPPYPSIARRRGYEGIVVLEVFVTKGGRVGRLRVFKSSGHKILDRAALRAVKNWVFEPGRRGEQAIDMWVKVPIKFVLK